MFSLKRPNKSDSSLTENFEKGLVAHCACGLPEGEEDAGAAAGQTVCRAVPVQVSLASDGKDLVGRPQCPDGLSAPSVQSLHTSEARFLAVEVDVTHKVGHVVAISPCKKNTISKIITSSVWRKISCITDVLLMTSNVVVKMRERRKNQKGEVFS